MFRMHRQNRHPLICFYTMATELWFADRWSHDPDFSQGRRRVCEEVEFVNLDKD